MNGLIDDGAMTDFEQAVWANGHGTSLCPALTEGSSYTCPGRGACNPPQGFMDGDDG